MPSTENLPCGPLRQAAARLLLAALLAFPLAGCSKDVSGEPKSNAAKPQPVPVAVAVAAQKNVPVQLRSIGNVQPFATVNVKAQVAGELVAVHFKEGQEVKKGDLLFTIDPKPFEAKLRQAEAALAKSKAQLLNARKQAERYGSVVKKGYVAEEQYDLMITNVAALEAEVKTGEATVESARLELGYCTIRSPLTGSAGDIKVDPGNIVAANSGDTPLVVINQVSPIQVAFSVPEQNLPEIKSHMAKGKLEVLAVPPGGESNPARGQLTFIDNTVDPATGTIQLKGTFSNEARSLWPGQFVNAILSLSEQAGAVVIPSQAVQTGQQGQYIYVVRPDSTVEYRTVAVSRNFDADAVIEKGIAPGETVVIDGQLRLAPDLPVKIAQKEVAPQ
ncbi:MAG: efflux RND transporter periplasmic adaptor subunit [Acidobacteriota bacterium]